jgi:hypothetical protein
MRYASICCLVASFAVSLSAQTVPRPGMIAAAAVVQNEPLVVETPVTTGAAITGRNTANAGAETIGVSGFGLTGVTGDGFLTGGIFTSARGTGVRSNGRYFGVWGACQAASGEGCAALYGQALAGTAVYAEGVVGVFGRALPNRDGISRQESLAGLFVGKVRVDGQIDAPIVSELKAQIAELSARLAALDGKPIYQASTIVPARIEAEDYDRGGQGVGYSDSSPGNQGGAYRTDDVDIKQSREGGYTVGWMTAGEWLAYTIDVPETGLYDFAARVGSALPGRTFRFEVDGVAVSGSLPVPAYPDWDRFDMARAPGITLSSGRHVVRIVVGNQDYFDLQWLEVTRQQRF